MLKRFRISDGSLIECREEPCSVLLYILPDDAEKAELVEKHRIGAHNLSSALDPDEIGRLEFDEDHLAIIMKRPVNYASREDMLFRVTSVGLFLFRDRLVIVTTQEDPEILAARHSLRISTLNDVVIRFISSTVAHFLGHLRAINMLSDSLEQKINTSMENKHLLNMFTIGKSLVYYLNGINSNSVVIDRIKSHAARIGLTEENLEVLDDLLIENNQCNKQAEIYSNILTGLMDARGSIVNNNLSLLIKRLTIINVVFLPLNFIASMGGMSEFTMMTHGVSWRVAYAVFGAAMVAIGYVTYRLVRGMGFELGAPRTPKRLRRRFPQGPGVR